MSNPRLSSSGPEGFVRAADELSALLPHDHLIWTLLNVSPVMRPVDWSNDGVHPSISALAVLPTKLPFVTVSEK